MQKFVTIMLAIVSMSMVFGFVTGIVYAATYAEISVEDNLVYMQIIGQEYIHEFE